MVRAVGVGAGAQNRGAQRSPRGVEWEKRPRPGRPGKIAGDITGAISIAGTASARCMHISSREFHMAHLIGSGWSDLPSQPIKSQHAAKPIALSPGQSQH